VNIASCAFLGSYMVVSAVSVYSNASLHHILPETIRRATIYQYYDVVFSAPFSAKGLSPKHNYFDYIPVGKFVADDCMQSRCSYRYCCISLTTH